jgi:hypothetical protein
MRVKLWAAASLAATGLFCCESAARADTAYEALANWTSLSTLTTGEKAGLASSYNRGGDTLNDYNNFDNYGGQPDGYSLVRQITGPGLVTRYWMPHLSANGNVPIRVIVDGQLLIDSNSSAILGGTYGSGPLFRSPLLQTRVGGQVSYEPIPFQNSLVIESTSAANNFYQWGYRTLPAATTVPSYNGSLNPAQTTQRNNVTTMLNNVGQNPAGTSGLTTASTSGATLTAASSVQLANLSGSGQIRALKLNLPTGVAALTDAQLTAVHLRVKYDGASGYAIDVPLAHFFGSGFGRADYQSLPMGVKNGAYYCYLPMPFRNGAVVELYNDGSSGAAPIPTLSTAVDYATGPQDPKAGYLHAVFQSETTTAGQATHNVLHATGSGKYIGNILYVRSGAMQSLEGNDLITVDGDTANTMHGTGLEDAYNGGYYYNSLGSPFSVDETGTTQDGPYSGLLALSGANADQYRWMIGDYVPFSSGIDVNIENAGGYGGVGWGSTAFYYSDVVPEPASLRLIFAASAGLLLRRRRG